MLRMLYQILCNQEYIQLRLLYKMIKYMNRHLQLSKNIKYMQWQKTNNKLLNIRDFRRLLKNSQWMHNLMNKMHNLWLQRQMILHNYNNWLM